MHMPERRKFSDYEKKTVYAQGNGKCGICGKPIKFSDMTIDHKIPLSKGGTNEFSNLQPACLICNMLKGELTTLELDEKLREILRFSRKKALSHILSGTRV